VEGILILGLMLVAGAFAVYVAMSRNRAKSEFFAKFASQRGLEHAPHGALPPSVPVLRRGDARNAFHPMRGVLPGGEAGTLAQYNYWRSSGGDAQGGVGKLTVALAELDADLGRAGTLVCRPKELSDLLPDSGPEKKLRPVNLESEFLAANYRISAGPELDQNWLRQLFSPSFIVWLAEEAPRGLAFECEEATVCAFVEGHWEDEARLDALCAGLARVAERLRIEASEHPGPITR
jgi:hypothetical protein